MYFPWSPKWYCGSLPQTQFGEKLWCLELGCNGPKMNLSHRDFPSLSTFGFAFKKFKLTHKESIVLLLVLSFLINLNKKKFCFHLLNNCTQKQCCVTPYSQWQWGWPDTKCLKAVVRCNHQAAPPMERFIWNDTDWSSVLFSTECAAQFLQNEWVILTAIAYTFCKQKPNDTNKPALLHFYPSNWRGNAWCVGLPKTLPEAFCGDMFPPDDTLG